MRRAWVAWFLAVSAVSIAASLVPTYRVRVKDTRSQLLWNADEAYLFIGTRLTGWRFSYLRLVGEVALASIQVTTPPQASKPSIVMLKITAATVERHVLENADMVWPAFTLFEHKIHYGVLWQWTGSNFDPLTPEERRRYLDAHVADGGFQNIDGWSNRYLSFSSVPAGGLRLDLVLAHQPTVLIINRERPQVTNVALARGNREVETLSGLDGRVRSVTKAEYEALFGR
jgi:hypothetical protein